MIFTVFTELGRLPRLILEHFTKKKRLPISSPFHFPPKPLSPRPPQMYLLNSPAPDLTPRPVFQAFVLLSTKWEAYAGCQPLLPTQSPPWPSACDSWPHHSTEGTFWKVNSDPPAKAKGCSSTWFLTCQQQQTETRQMVVPVCCVEKGGWR